MTLATFLLRVLWFALGYAYCTFKFNPHPPFTWPNLRFYLGRVAYGLIPGSFVAGLVWLALALTGA